MGGQSGETRGKSKIEAYLEYERLIEKVGEIFLSQNPNPKNKKLCKKLMMWDPDTEEWVLYYRLHT